jgi:hypothetical protein
LKFFIPITLDSKWGTLEFLSKLLWIKCLTPAFLAASPRTLACLISLSYPPLEESQKFVRPNTP